MIMCAAHRLWHRWVRRGGKTILALLLSGVVVMTAYLAFVAVRRVQPLTLPIPTGPYQVGRVAFDWTDHSRIDPLAGQRGTPRKLSVWLWYPAASHVTGQPAPYVPGAWGKLHMKTPWPGVFEGSFDAIRGHSLAGVPVADGQFPIVVLEPGMGFAAPYYNTFTENLASHGYLVAGVTPTYSANVTVLDEHVVSSTKAGNPDDFDAAEGNRLVDVWAADARFVADKVAALDRSGKFAGRINSLRTAYIGHSFGGATALEACRTDSRCAGAVDMDGTQFGTVVRTGLNAPLMILGAQNSCVTGTCRPADAADYATLDAAQSLLAASVGPTWCYAIDGTKHFNFSDHAAFYLAAPMRSLLPLGHIDGARGLVIQNAYLVAFLDHTVRATPQPLLTGQSRAYPEVRVQRMPRT
ncbi:MAG: alpha/beta hydrolase family protein [Candidatus Dormibacteraceae bacterium]